MAYTRVQNAVAAFGGTSTSSGAATFTNPVGSGNWVFVGVGFLSVAGDTITSIVDDQSNNYTLVDGIRDSSLGYSYFTAVGRNLTNGPTSVTVTLNNARTFLTIIIKEESGFSPLAFVDAHAAQVQVGPGTGTDVVTSGTATTSAAGDYIDSSTVNLGGNAVATAGTGYTTQYVVPVAFVDEDQTQSAAGSIAGTFTNLNATDGATVWLTALIAVANPPLANAPEGWFHPRFVNSALFSPLLSPQAKGWFEAKNVDSSQLVINATLAQTLGTLTSTATGTVTVSGTLTKTLGALTSAVTGTVLDQAALTQTLGALTLAGTAQAIDSAALAQTLAPVTLAGTGITIVSATLSQTLGALTSVATGTVAVSGTASPTLGALTSAATGTVSVSGSLAQTLEAVTATATGGPVDSATLSQTLGALTLTATGAAIDSATLAQTLAGLTSAATGTVLVSGTLAQTLGTLTSSATGTVRVSGTLAQTLAALSSVATGVAIVTATLGQTLGDLTLAATGVVTSGRNAFLAQTLADLTLASAGTVRVSGALVQTLAPTTLTATVTVRVSAALAQTLAPVTAVATANAIAGANLSQTLGPLTLAATGTVLPIAPPANAVLNVTLGPLTIVATMDLGIVLSRVNVQLWDQHTFSGRFWPNRTVFDSRNPAPPDFHYTPLMVGLDDYNTALVNVEKVKVFGRYDAHGNLLDNPPLVRPIDDPQPEPPVGNRTLLPLGNLNH